MSLFAASRSNDSCRRRPLHLSVLLLVAAPLFAAASQDGCDITIRPAEPDPAPPTCDLECEYGFKSDLEGNQYCECLEGDACIDIYAPPHENPETGECVQFGDVCNIPSDWEECSNEGCEVDGVVYPFGADVPTNEECTACRCRSDGEVVCEGTPCVEPGCTVDGVTYRPGDSFLAPDGCNTCYCGEDGDWGCTEMDCLDGCVHDGTNYEFGESFPAGDGCNTCSCMDNGEVACTLMACLDGCEYNGRFYEEGESFPADDGCNTCYCDAGGSIACTEMACIDGCNYNGTVYEPGESFPADDGCNTCFCDEDGGVSCTEIACTDCLLACEYGFKQDSTGHQYCECREGDVCIDLAPAPHFDPNDEDGQCIEFPSVCDIPNAFLPCEQAPPVRCDDEVLCDMIPPECPDGQVPEIVNGCYGDCIDVERCE